MKKAALQIQPPPKEEGLYRVVYVIDVNASNCRDAAKLTYKIMADPESIKPVFEVIDHKGKVTKIDLSQEKEDL